jgi:methionine synthase II (cobalamin-independent)
VEHQQICTLVYIFAEVGNHLSYSINQTDHMTGNFINAHHFSEGGYDRIAVKLFNELNTSTYYLEYDTERAGGFEPLKQLPKHKNLILGVVSTKLHEVEDKDDMKKKVLAAAETMAEGNFASKEEALKNLGISPQCGFSTHVEGYPLSHDEMKVKMTVIRKLCDELWPGEV